jgi:hypothetical protein
LPGNTLPLVCDENPTIVPQQGGAVYTTGNLGKGWNELDLVPFRITVKPGDSTTFSFYVAADMALDPAVLTPADCVVLPDQNGVVNPKACGYDFITTPVLRADSDATCSILAIGPQSNLFGVTGGTASTIFRQVTMSAAKGASCILQWDNRLALGSHLFPGSSLQVYMFPGENLSGSKKTLSIPVQGILPPSVSKTETSSQGSDHIWTVSKTPSPLNLDIPNTCTAQTAAQQVTIKINWAKQPAVAGGPVTIVAIISAQNNAARTISVGGTDKLYRGSTQTDLLQTDTVAPVDVAPNSTQILATLTVVDKSPGGATQYNDVFSATFTDKLTGFPIPGSLNASASSTVQFSGPEANTSATIVDIETISDTFAELQFTLDSASTDKGAISCTPSAPSGKVTTATCTITGLSSAAAKTDSGTITLLKTVSVKDSGAVVTNGKLSDTATLTGNDSGGFPPATASASATVNITSEAKETLTVNKSVDSVPPGSPTQNFSFAVSPGTGFSLAFNPGDTSKSNTLSDLDPANYTVTETANPHYNITSANPQTFSGAVVNGIAACTGTLNFTNALIPQPLVPSIVPSTTFRRTYHFNITKGVASNSLGQTPPDSVTTSAAQVTFNYEIKVAQTDFVDDQFAASAVLTLVNPNFYPISGIALSTTFSSTCTFGAFTGTVPAGGTVNVTLSCAPSNTKPLDSLVATATWGANGYPGDSKSASTGVLSFGATPTTQQVCNPGGSPCVAGTTIHVTDTFNGGPTDPLGTVTAVDIQGLQPATTFKVSRIILVKTGCFTYPNVAGITETSQIAQATVKVCGTSGELAPTQTTCGQFVSGTNLQQSGVNYSVSGGLINNNENPGVFFYFTKFVPAANASSVTITQVNDGLPGNYNFGVQSAQLFTASCTQLSSSFSGSAASTIMNFSLQKGVQYIVAVKYSAKSITGQKDVTSAGSCDGVIGDACYSYNTIVNGVSVDHNLNNFVLTKGSVTEF